MQGHVDQAPAAAEEYATAISTLQEAYNKDNSQAQDKKPRRSDNLSCADPVV